MSKPLRVTLSAAFVLWIAFVLAAFFAVQKPITPDDGPAMADGLAGFVCAPTITGAASSVLDLLAAAAIGFAALLAGARAMPLKYPGAASPLRLRTEYWLLSAGLGFGLIGITMLILALAGVLSLVLTAMIALLLLMSAPGLVRQHFSADLRQMASVRLSRPVLIFLLLSLTLALLSALTPPTAWDALVYHLTVPQRALLAGRLLPSGDIVPQENFPLLMSSLYLLAMLVRGDVAAQCLHFIYGLMTFGLIALTAHQFYSRGAVPIALTIALSMPMLLLLASWPYNDVALAFYTLAALFAYMRWLEERSHGYLVLAGLMAGFALGLKYTSFLLPLGILAFLLHDARQSRLRLSAIFALACAAAAAPWYLKNWLFTGNPVYPFLFGGQQWDLLRATWYARPGTGIGLDFIALLTMPIVTTLGYRDTNFVDGRIGPLILLLLPLLFIRRPDRGFPSAGPEAPRRLRLDRFVILFLLFYAAWAAGIVGSQSLWQSRLLLPALVVLIPPLAQAVAQLKEFDLPSASTRGVSAFSLFRITRIIFALVLGLTLLTQAVEFVKLDPLAYVTGAETREQFLLRQTGAHAAAMSAVHELPAAARVQFMWEPRSYLAQRTVRADPLLDALPHLVLTTGSVDEGVRLLKSEGFTHVLVWEAGAKFAIDNLRDQFGERDAQDLKQLESDYARVVYENSAYRLLELK
jgi:hypothetical protein